MQKNIKKYWPVFTLPVMAAFAIGFVIPFAMGIYLSFTKFTTVKDAQWVGLSNYEKLLADQTYLHSFFLTVAFAAVTIILINIIAFAIAMALTKELKGTNIFRTVFFMPNLIG
ncbi:MAG: sugar ABC transporter permease, partial [Bulleidia sp.]|nr:sugar ABC transporter permease [Bulleidia sp.]